MKTFLSACFVVLCIPAAASEISIEDIPQFRTDLSPMQLELAYHLQQGRLLQALYQARNDIAKTEYKDQDIRKQQQVLCFTLRPEHRRLAETSIALARKYPDDPGRWDAVLLAVEHLERYQYYALYDENCVVWTEADVRAGIDVQRDPFRHTATYGEILKLLDQSLLAADIPLVTYIRAVDFKVRFLKEGAGADPGWNELVRARRRGEAWATQQQFDARLAEVRRLLEALERRLPADDVGRLPKRHGIWSARNDALYWYARMLRRAMEMRVLRDPSSPEAYVMSELVRWRKLQSLFDEPLDGEPGERRKMLAQLEAEVRAVQSVDWAPFKALDGNTVDMSALRGKVVVLHYWSADKPASVAELSGLKSTYFKHHARGLEMIGVSLDEEAARARAVELLQSQAIPWLQRFDGMGASTPAASQFGVTAAPALLLLDKRGVLVSSRLRGAALEREIERRLAEPPFEYANAVELLPYHSAWSYLDTGEPPTSDWTTSAGAWKQWKSGQASLGYRANVSTFIERFRKGAGQPQAYAAAFFARVVDVPAEQAGRDFVLNLRIDDGAVVYVNGEEIGRVRMTDGIVTHVSLASEVGDLMSEVELRGRTGLLRAGRNIVAVSVHQKELTSSDLAFDLRMLALPAADSR